MYNGKGFPKENTGKIFLVITHISIFLDQSPKAKEIHAKINRWDLIKFKSLCTAKEAINKTKRQPMEWEKIFANHKTNKGLISKVYKYLIQLNIMKTNNPIKMGRRPRHFPKKDIQMANGHMKKCSTLLIRKMQIKTSMQHHLILIRMSITKKSTNNREFP